MNTIAKKIVVLFVAAGIVAGLGAPFIGSAAVVEPGFEIETVAQGFSLPTAMAFAPDGRVFVAEKGGAVRVVKNGVLLSAPAINLTDINTFGDRGLIGLAIDPNFATNGYLYLSYTYENSPGSNFGGPKTGRIARVTVVGDTASESTKVVIVGNVGGTAALPSCEDYAMGVDCIPSDSPSHTVGGLKFGPDGKLYATLGDGADFSAVDPRALRAQNLDSLAGKLLRINPDGGAPTDNPYYNGNASANRSKVYALGVRNMYRLGFHPTTGMLFGGDVGWNTWEEINKIVPGANYGWPCREGNGTTTYNCTPSSATTNPTYTYGHDSAGAGSVTVGAFPASGAYPPAYNNTLFIGDYAQNWMKLLELDAAGNMVAIKDFIPDNIWPVDIATGPDGNIYYLDIAFESLNRITHTTGNRRPVPVVAANPTSGLTPLSVAFSSAGSMDPDGNPLTYSWNFGDGSANSALANPTHVYNTNGTYTATLTLTDSLGSSASKSIVVNAGNQAPTASIDTPASGSL
jgi:glucose/arabinose dehydrogenase